MKKTPLKNWIVIGSIILSPLVVPLLVSCSGNEPEPIENTTTTEYKITSIADLKAKQSAMYTDYKTGKKSPITFEGTAGKVTEMKSDKPTVDAFIEFIASANPSLTYKCQWVAGESGMIMTYEKWVGLKQPNFGGYYILKEEEGKFPAEIRGQNTIIDLKLFEISTLDQAISKLSDITATPSAKIVFKDFVATLTNDNMTGFKSLVSALKGSNVAAISGNMKLVPGASCVFLDKADVDILLGLLVDIKIQSKEATDGTLENGQYFYIVGVTKQYLSKIADDNTTRVRAGRNDLKETGAIIPDTLLNSYSTSTAIGHQNRENQSPFFKNLPFRRNGKYFGQGNNFSELEQVTVDRMLTPANKGVYGVDSVARDIEFGSDPYFEILGYTRFLDYGTVLVVNQSLKLSKVNTSVVLEYPLESAKIRFNTKPEKLIDYEGASKALVNYNALAAKWPLCGTNGKSPFDDVMNINSWDKGFTANPKADGYLVVIPVSIPSAAQKAAMDAAVINYINYYCNGIKLSIEGLDWISLEEIVKNYPKININSDIIGRSSSEGDGWTPIERFIETWGENGTMMRQNSAGNPAQQSVIKPTAQVKSVQPKTDAKSSYGYWYGKNKAFKLKQSDKALNNAKSSDPSWRFVELIAENNRLALLQERAAKYRAHIQRVTAKSSPEYAA